MPVFYRPLSIVLKWGKACLLGIEHIQPPQSRVGQDPELQFYLGD